MFGTNDHNIVGVILSFLLSMLMQASIMHFNLQENPEKGQYGLRLEK